MRARPDRRAAAQAGFSLLEVIISLAILAAASTVLLQRSRGLIDYATRSRRHYEAASELLSKAARLPTLDLANAQFTRNGDRLTLRPTGRDEFPVTIRNYALHGVAVPISQGIAPFQLYEIEGPLGRRLALLTADAATLPAPPR
jgi:prepilin-type N-terminal cleavage/methylation domain-containing protein